MATARVFAHSNPLTLNILGNREVGCPRQRRLSIGGSLKPIDGERERIANRSILIIVLIFTVARCLFPVASPEGR
jgi:hypothetical protein